VRRAIRCRSNSATPESTVSISLPIAVEVFAHGSPNERKFACSAAAEFEELAYKAGINPISFFIVRSSSPVISQLAPGVFSLVGAAPTPGLIEELTARNRISRRLVQHGWDNSGRLWCVVNLSLAVLAAGSIALPVFVADLVQGDWVVSLPDGSNTGVANCKGTFLYPLRKSLSYLGAEPDDLVLFAFDLQSRALTIRIGGQELIDLAEGVDVDPLIDE
jgi:hypothetical protein